jgi:DNA polymerase elongation subunit (family B)
MSEADGRNLISLLPKAIDMMRRNIEVLYQGKVSPSDLIVTRRLSREVDDFKGNSESASAAKQLLAHHRAVQVGQKLEYIYVCDKKPGVRVVDHRHWPEDQMIDKRRYCELLMRAIYQLLSPLGIQEKDMPALAGEGIRQLPLFGG